MVVLGRFEVVVPGGFDVHDRLGVRGMPQAGDVTHLVSDRADLTRGRVGFKGTGVGGVHVEQDASGARDVIDHLIDRNAPAVAACGGRVRWVAYDDKTFALSRPCLRGRVVVRSSELHFKIARGNAIPKFGGRRDHALYAVRAIRGIDGEGERVDIYA